MHASPEKQPVVEPPLENIHIKQDPLAPLQPATSRDAPNEVESEYPAGRGPPPIVRMRRQVFLGNRLSGFAHNGREDTDTMDKSDGRRM